MRSLCSLLILALVFAGCSKRQTNRPDQLDFGSLIEARKVLNGDQVRCEGSCPEHVGAFYMLHSPEQKKNSKVFRVNLCSFTLVDNDKILTNHHCIEGILKEGDACNTEAVSIQLKFPKTSSHAFKTMKCKKVLKTSKEFFYKNQKNKLLRRKTVPDWALIQLEESVSDRQPVTLQKGSFGEEVDVDLFPVYFDTSFEPTLGVIKQVSCKQTFNDQVRIFSASEDSPLFSIGNCSSTLIKGNSGSGVFLRGQPKLLGVMATVATNRVQAEGTLAHCLPDLNSGSGECLFNDDREYVEVSKQISYFARGLRKPLAELRASPQWSQVSQIEWREEALKIEDMGPISIELQGQWGSLRQYLQKQNSPQLMRRHLWALTRALMPRVPKCVRANMLGAAANLNIPLLQLGTWDTSGIAWSETIKETKDGEVYVLHFKDLDNNNYGLKNTSMSVKKEQNFFVLSTEKDLPPPFKNLKLKLPPCTPN